MQETHRCAICAAEFGSSQDLVQHEQKEHSRRGTTADQQEEVAPESGSARPREGHEFTRRNVE